MPNRAPNGAKLLFRKVELINQQIVLPRLISHEQACFVWGWNIHLFTFIFSTTPTHTY